MINTVDRLIFVHIQKTGGSSISAALSGQHSPPEKHLSAVELRELYGPETWDSCFRFSIVRNPWDRLVSWWSMIDAHREKYNAGAKLNGFQQYVLSHATSFEEFLTRCDKEVTDPDGVKWIYRNQIDHLTDAHGQVMVDFIGRFEALARDFDTACHLGCGHSVKLPRINVSVHEHYTTYYTPKLVSLVAERFRKDIQQFGYTFGDPAPSRLIDSRDHTYTPNSLT